MTIIAEAMKEAAVRFALWVNKNRYSKYWGSDKPNDGKWYVQYTKPDRKYYTTEELYDMFLEHERSRLGAGGVVENFAHELPKEPLTEALNGFGLCVRAGF